MKENLKDCTRIIGSLGMPIIRTRPGDGPLRIFLPDNHNQRYQEKQTKRIATIDQAVNLDIIALEGLGNPIGDLEAAANTYAAAKETFLTMAPDGFNKIIRRRLLHTLVVYLMKDSIPYPYAPGLSYLPMDTNAGKIGMEDQVLHKKTCDWYNAIMSTKTLGLLYAADNRESMDKTHYAFLMRWEEKLKTIAHHYINTIPEEFQADAIRTAHGFPSWFNKLAVDERTAAWIKNTQQYDISLVVGGEAHSKKFYEYSDGSTIILNEL